MNSTEVQNLGDVIAEPASIIDLSALSVNDYSIDAQILHKAYTLGYNKGRKDAAQFGTLEGLTLEESTMMQHMDSIHAELDQKVDGLRNELSPKIDAFQKESNDRFININRELASISEKIDGINQHIDRKTKRNRFTITTWITFASAIGSIAAFIVALVK